jgi:hypothetical protein
MEIFQMEEGDAFSLDDDEDAFFLDDDEAHCEAHEAHHCEEDAIDEGLLEKRDCHLQ